MRKFLWVVAVGALVLALAAPAMALDFKFAGQYRVRFYDGANVPILFTAAQVAAGQNFGTNPRGAQIRVRPIFDVSDDAGKITARLHLEIGDVEFGNGGGASVATNQAGVLIPGTARVGPGMGGSMGNDGINVETKNAYIDAALPFDIPARLRAGIMPIYLPKGIVVDDDVAGVKFYGAIAPFKYELAWYRVSGGPANVAAPAAGIAGMATTSNVVDNNYDFWGGKLDAAFVPWFNPGLYYFYGANRVNCTVTGALVPATCPNRVRDVHFVGLTVTGKVGTVSYDLDWVYGSAEGGVNGAFALGPGAANPITVKGWVIDGAVHFPVGPITVNLAGTYGTGDSSNGGDSEAFPYISPSWNGAGGGFEMIGSGGPFDAVEFTQDYPANIWMIGGWLEYRPVKALWLKLGYGYAGFAKKNGNCTAATIAATGNPCWGPAYVTLQGKSGIGHELTLRADYDIWTGFKAQAQAGWLFTSATGNSIAGEYVLQLLYNF